MGIYLKFIRPGAVNEVSLIGFILLLFAIFGGRWISTSSFASIFTLSQTTLVWFVMAYTFIAAIIPAWILLTTRDLPIHVYEDWDNYYISCCSDWCTS